MKMVIITNIDNNHWC